MVLILASVALPFVAAGVVMYRSTSEAFVETRNEEIELRSAGGIETRIGPELEQAYNDGGWADVRSRLLAGGATGSTRGYQVFVVNRQDALVASNNPVLVDAAVTRTGERAYLLSGVSAGEADYETSVEGGFVIRDDAGTPVADLFAIPVSVNKDAGDAFAAGVWRSAGASFAGILVISTGLSVMVLRLSLRPLKDLTSAATELCAGGIPSAVAERGGTEFRTLIQAFNSAIETMSRTDSIRRRWVSDVAHELRTPLGNIRSIVEAAEMGLIETPSEASKCLRAELHLLERLVEDFQQLSLSDTGQLRVNLIAVPLADLVKSSLQPMVEARPVQLTVDISERLEVVADGDRLRQVFCNLMENSMRHRSDGLSVKVVATERDATAVIGFSDNGPGIDLSDRPYVFERLYRADKSRNRATGGAGLGLAITKSLVEAMHGAVELADQPVGSSGTRFEIFLPMPSPGNPVREPDGSQ